MTTEIILFALSFPLLWLGIFGCISLLGGWHKLASRFRTDTPRPDGALAWQTAALLQGGIPSGYNRILHIHAGPNGIHLSVPCLLRFLHPPLLIPWADTKKVERVEFMCRESTLVELNDILIRIRFYGRAGDLVFQQFKKSRKR